MTKTLNFNGKTVELDALTKSFKSMPVIELSRKDVSSAQLLANVSTGFSSTDTVAVYKHEDKYVVFSGHDKVKEFLASEEPASMNVRLISKQLLKHMVTMSVPLQWQNSQATRVERQMEEERFQEERAAGQAYQPAPGRGPGQRPQGGFRPFEDRRPRRA